MCIRDSCYTDRTVHFIFENSYFELCTYQLNTTITWLTQSVPATNLPDVYKRQLVYQSEL